MSLSTAASERVPDMRMDRDADGRIPVAPLTGFGLVLVAESVCMLRLEFARTRKQLNGHPEFVQLALSPVQARALAEALVSAAEAGYAAPANVAMN